MPIEKAKKHYLGKEGHQKFNCAQSIVAAFKEHLGLDPKMINEYAKYGGGNAPNNLCGAYFAALKQVERLSPDKVLDFESHFFTLAGSLKCNEIRQQRKLSCLGCIEKAAEYLTRLSAKPTPR
ncbi:MAG: C-GCAxxG-C-C family (seleno)protein [Candidatus Margulisiibacteriota bacterium]